MKKVDFLIIGQGVAGTVFAHQAMKRGVSVHVLDDGHHTSSSMAAAGIMNPITGRKYIKSWKAEVFIPYATRFYRELEDYLDVRLLSEVDIYRALYSIEDENTFDARGNDPVAARFIVESTTECEYSPYIANVSSYGVVRGGGQVDLPVLLSAYRNFLERQQRYTRGVFDYDRLVVNEDHVTYGDICAKHIVFCEGSRGVDNPFFGDKVSYEPVKGEALVVQFPEQSFSDILRHKIFIAPIGRERYWIGSGYQWDFEDHKPSADGGASLEEKLRSITDLRYEIIDHRAGVRPSVKSRRPKMGRHPDYPQLLCFNGLGTKGTSLAPYCADHFLDHILNGDDIDEELSIH